jgi:hypothetical protein
VSGKRLRNVVSGKRLRNVVFNNRLRLTNVKLAQC